MAVYQDKERKTYYFSVTYKDWNGQQKRKLKRGFKLARDAKAAEREFLAQYAQQPDFTFQAMYELYIADCRTRQRPSTVHTKEAHFEHAILPFFHALKLSEITPAHVRRWQNDMMNNYAPTTQKQIHGILSALFNFAMRFYHLASNPARIAGSIGTLKSTRAKFWTVEQFNAAMKFVAPKYRAFLNLAFYSGLRPGELLALEIRDYNPTARTITVTKSLEYIKGVYYIGPTKNAQSTRVVTIPATVCNMLDEYISRLYEPEPQEPLFLLVYRVSLLQHLNRAAKKAGLENIRLHDLRHSHASLLINLGVNILAISRRLGHSDIKTTLNIYGHLYHTTNEEIAAQLDDIIMKKSPIS